MSYSRRQLYAFGETFGDSATSREAGGRIVYGGGGGGSPTPQPTTTITETEPTVTNRTSVNEIPQYLTSASQDLIARGQALTSRPYEAYTGPRVAEFSPLMNQAFERIGGQQVAGQIGEATGLASLAGQRAMDYGQFQQGVQQYMNPYMQNVVDIERRKAQEAADQQAAMLSGQAAKQGAFGGSGAALQQRALRRDTAQQLADIQAQGLDRAYQSAVGQYNQGISSGLAAAGQLGGLGQQQFGQQMDITQGLGLAGDVQRQREQALMDVKYGDFLAEKKYPYEQLAFQQGLISGVPYSTTQRTNEVSAPGKSVSQQVAAKEQPSAASQLVGAGLTAYGMTNGGGTDDPYGINSANRAAGGEVKSYADGGITSLLSDQQIAQRKQMPISDLARLALQAEEMERARAYADQQNMMAQQAMMDQGSTVYDDEMRQIAAIEQGIGGLEVPDDLVSDEGMAGGGIVAFSNGGVTEADVRKAYDAWMATKGPWYMPTPRANTEERAAEANYERVLRAFQSKRPASPIQSAAPVVPSFTSTDASDSRFARGPAPDMSGTRGLPSIAPLEKTAAMPEEKAPTGPGAPPVSDKGIVGLLRSEADRARDEEAKAAKLETDALAADRIAQEAAVAEAEKYGSDREERLKKREEGMRGAKERNLNTTFIEAGLAIMAGESSNALLNIARGARQGLQGYEARLEKINASKEKLDDDFARLYELRQEKVGAAKDRKREIDKAEAKLKADGIRNLSAISGALAGKEIEIKQKDLDRAMRRWEVSQTRSSEKERLLAQLAKYPAGTEKGDQLRQNLEYLGGVGKPAPGAADVVKSLNTRIDRASMMLLGKKDPTERALIEDEIRGLKAELAQAQGRSGSVGGGGSGTLNAADQALIDKYR